MIVTSSGSDMSYSSAVATMAASESSTTATLHHHPS